ncbi:MAG: immunoglobulin-like domain-containing protein [Chitinivibrionales bacterium]
MKKKTIIAAIFSTIAFSFGQQLRVDSVTVDSVWNSDSSFFDANGVAQTRQSRDVLLSFKPIGPDSIQASFAISIDSARTWNPVPNPLLALDSGKTKSFACNQTCHSNLRVLGGDRANTAFKVIIFFKDTVAPVIALLGPNPDTVKVGDNFVEPGGTVTDDRDGIIPFDSVKVTELTGKQLPINTSVPGVFTLVYSVKDKAGNAAIQKTRVVRVVGVSIDVTPPVIHLVGAASCTVSVGTPFVDPGATATDDVDGVISERITKVIKNSANAQVSFADFYAAIGLYTITYSVSDQAGNAAIPVIRSITVRDTTTVPPTTLFQKYGVPLASPLQSINIAYKSATVDPSGSGPNMSNVTQFTLNWSLPSLGLFQFSFTFSASPFYVNFSPAQTFGQANPGFTLTGSGIYGLDGSYYITASAAQCVWVRTDGSFAIVFTP